MMFAITSVLLFDEKSREQGRGRERERERERESKHASVARACHGLHGLHRTNYMDVMDCRGLHGLHRTTWRYGLQRTPWTAVALGGCAREALRSRRSPSSPSSPGQPLAEAQGLPVRRSYAGRVAGSKRVVEVGSPMTATVAPMTAK